MGSITDSSVFWQDPNWYVKLYVPFNGIECDDQLASVSQIVHTFVELTCGVDVYAEVSIVYCVL